MTTFEKEILSIPAGRSYDNVVDSFVYECSDNDNYLPFNKIPLFIAFRKDNGGEMEKLYMLEVLLRINFKNDYTKFLKSNEHTNAVKNKVKRYVENFQKHDKLSASISNCI